MLRIFSTSSDWTGPRGAGPAILGLLLAAFIFAVDLHLPAGYAGSSAYVLPLLLGLWIPGRRYVIGVAIGATIASIAARLWAPLPEGVAGALVWMNRATSWFAIWTTAFGLLLYKSAQSAAENERAKHQAILAAAADGMITIDERGMIELFNHAAERMFGRSSDAAIGTNFASLLTEPYRDEYDLRHSPGPAHPQRLGVTREVEGLRQDGSTFPLELAIAEVPLTGRRIFTAILRDVTERKTHERIRDELLASLTEKNAELERFTYTVSHDLKSPLVTIKGFLGLLARSAKEGDTERLEQDVARIEAAADRMKQLLDELLELSRIGRVAGPHVTVSLDELVAETVEALSGAIAQGEVRIGIEPHLPPVRGDRVRIQQVIQNLLENAVKFLGNQANPSIEIGARRDGEHVLCWVRDNGIGIDPKYSDKIFGLFEKLDRQSSGTGVGLALVKRIIEVHGGRIWVESEGAACGSRFCFTLPADDHAQEKAA